MKPELIYVELKSGYSDRGPAWIGKGEYSKSGQMIYFNGFALRRLQRRQNFETHVNPETGDYYWVSGVKKDQTDRHWAGGGMIMIDRAVVKEYLDHVGVSKLNKTKYKVVTFVDNSSIRARANVEENRKIANGMGTLLSEGPPHTTNRTDRVISGSAAIDRMTSAE